jgi:hypothetical protein
MIYRTATSMLTNEIPKAIIGNALRSFFRLSILTLIINMIFTFQKLVG